MYCSYHQITVTMIIIIILEIELIQKLKQMILHRVNVVGYMWLMINNRGYVDVSWYEVQMCVLTSIDTYLYITLISLLLHSNL